MKLTNPRLKTIKRLFAVSGNCCYFPNCNTPLVDEERGIITGEICHIKGKKPLSPRYDSNQSDEERHGFDNLLLMCPIHHTVIDDDTASYSHSRLIEIKSGHEKIHADGKEPSDDVAKQFILNISKKAVIFTKNQKGGQVAHSIININYEENTRLIQAFFNRIVLFVQRIVENNTSDIVVNTIISDFNNSKLKNTFGMVISQTRRGLDNTVEFLNGRYTLRIEIHKDGIKYSLYKDKEHIDLTNQIERIKFFEDLQNFSTLTTGFEPVLPNNLKILKDHIISIHKNLSILLRIFKKLYKTEAKSSHSFVEIIHRSEGLREYFGISAPSPTRPGVPIDDIPIHILDGKYRIIPNSATLSVENDGGQYDNILSKNSSSDSINIELSKIFEDIINYIKKEYDIRFDFNGIITFECKNTEKGYCIRCGTNKDFNIFKPYCWDCYQVWAEYYNTEFRENYCHQCGNYYKTTINRPLCNKCYWNE
jgi:hypothetical protein